jgi:3-isopropylmalate/(R)-2-methylmalate dehydratase small subunit
MEDVDPEFSEKVASGDVIVAGTNFGCGSSREHAPLAIKSSGVSCVIASSFARIFYRNSINIGLPILEMKDAPKKISAGDQIEVDLQKGTVRNISSDKVYHSEPFPPFMQEIINAGGLVNRVKKQLEDV